MKNICSLFLTFILVNNFSFCQNADSLKVLTLSDVISSLNENPSLQVFDERINSYHEYAKGARSLSPPTLSGGLWMFPYSRFSDKSGASDGGALMIGVEQMIMNPSKRRAEQEYMEGMSSVEETMKEYDRQMMIEEAKKIYYEWIVLEKKLSVLKESEDLIKLMIKSAEIGYTYNQNQLSRIYKAKSELYTIQNMQIMMENNIRQMNIELNTLMNIDKDIVFDIDTSYVMENYDILPVDSASVFSNRSDIKNIQESLNLFNLKRELELSKSRPDFGIQYGHMNTFGNMPNQFNLMGMVTIPIAPWSSKGYKANLAGINYDQKALEHKKESIINQVVGNLEKLKTDIGNKKRQIVMYEEHLIPALQKNFNTSLLAFENMKEDMFMTIDAWTSLKMAKIEYLDLIAELLKLQASYERQIEKQ